MKPLFLGILHALWTDEMAARRWLRGLLLGAATGCASLAVSVPEWRIPLAVGGAVCGLLGGLVSVGEPNPKPEP